MAAEPRALPAALHTRLERELEGVASVYLSPPLRGAVAVPSGVRACEEPAKAEVAFVYARELSPSGDTDVVLPGPTRRVTAVMVLANERRIRQRLDVAGTRVSRVLTELAVLDVQSAGLVIVELAKGVSAVDLQALAEPTLLISPQVEEMKP